MLKRIPNVGNSRVMFGGEDDSEVQGMKNRQKIRKRGGHFMNWKMGVCHCGPAGWMDGSSEE